MDRNEETTKKVRETVRKYSVCIKTTDWEVVEKLPDSSTINMNQVTGKLLHDTEQNDQFGLSDLLINNSSRQHGSIDRSVSPIGSPPAN